MGDVQQDRLLPKLPAWSIPETSSPDGNTHPQISVCGERLAALHLVSNPEPLQRRGHRVDKRLEMIYMRPYSGEDARVAGVYVNCIAAGAPHCHMFLYPHELPSHAHKRFCGYDPECVRWSRPEACCGSCPV